MNADKERLKMLLSETIAYLCQRGLTFKQELRVQGLLGITVDGDVFLVPVDERTCNDVEWPLSVNHETEASVPFDSTPQRHNPAVHQEAPPPKVADVRGNFVSAAENHTCHASLSQYPSVINKPGLLPVTKTEILDVDDIESSADNEIQEFDSRSDEYVYASQPVHPPVLYEHSFLTATSGFRNSTTVGQVDAAVDEVKNEGKRKRRQSSFGDDMLMLSPTDDEWTNSSQRGLLEPVAGCSQWANFGQQPQHSIAVSIFKC